MPFKSLMSLSVSPQLSDPDRTASFRAKAGKVPAAVPDGYGGKLLPGSPGRLIDGIRPQRLSWLWPSEALPWICRHGMLKGHGWLAQPDHRDAA